MKHHEPSGLAGVECFEQPISPGSWSTEQAGAAMTAFVEDGPGNSERGILAAADTAGTAEHCAGEQA